MKKIVLLLALVLSSCATTSQNTYIPSDSLCIDAAVVNMRSAGCEEVIVKKVNYYVYKISCASTRVMDKDNIWLTSHFLAIKQGVKIPKDMVPICGDSVMLLAKKKIK